MSLVIDVLNTQQHQRLEHAGGPLEFGRGPQQECKRVVIDDMFVSRDQLRIAELPGGQVRLENLSSRNPIELANGAAIASQQSRELPLPVRLSVGKTRIVVEGPALAERPAAAETSFIPATPEAVVPVVAEAAPIDGLATIESSKLLRRSAAAFDLKRQAGDASLGWLADWLQTVIELQQAPAGSTELFKQTAQALVDLVKLDLGLVLERRDGQWSIVGSAAANDQVAVHYSRTLLEHVARERRTFYQDLNQFTSQAMSLANIQSAVVSPIFGLEGDVAGALYGVRTQQGLVTRGNIESLEAQLVQLLAAAVGANWARSLAARTRMQFEQFFSPELVRELERDPKLLEGRFEEVTVLFSDLRGFTALAQRLGAEKTCRVVRDMMERLSERIVEHGGVIVDYAGDGILAMWNAPARQPDHAARACRAALTMLDELPDLNARWAEETAGANLALGIGINTGLAQVGNTGSSRKLKYGPHGHTVNLASRVQDATKHLGIPLLIAEPTRQQLSPEFCVRRLGQVRLPGVKEPVVLHELRGATADAAWLAQRDAYERALALYEARQWPQACGALMPLVSAAAGHEQFDVPTLKLMRRAWECLEQPPEEFDPIIETTTK